MVLRMRGGVAVGLVLIGLASCKSVPMDPYARAERAVEDGQLLLALESLDLIPPVHPRYPEARTLAQAVERRMRAGQEMLLRGLLLRTEWRDEEAIRYFEFANQIWPAILGAENLVRATHNRMKSLDQVGSGATEPGSATNTLPVQGIGHDPEGGGEELTMGPPAVPGPETLSGAIGAGESPTSLSPRELVSIQLTAVENLLTLGDLREALAELEDIYILHPHATNVRLTLARTLHQRALVRYGQGYLEAAIADWVRVRALDESLTQVRQFLHAARAELSERKRP